jgi:hypothetical protein
MGTYVGFEVDASDPRAGAVAIVIDQGVDRACRCGETEAEGVEFHEGNGSEAEFELYLDVE